MVYRAEESIRHNDDVAGPNVDEALIKELLRFLECDVDQLLSVNRLGRFNAENIAQRRFRPLKVRFKTNEARDQVLNNLSKLRHAPKELNTLSIRQDLNYEQRQELNKKIEEAKALSQGLENSIFRVRGSLGNYHLVQFNFRNRNFLPQGTTPVSRP